MPDPVQHILQLVILAATGMLLSLQLGLGHHRPQARKALLGVLAVLSALSIGTYFRMGQLHGYGPHGNHSYHYHDIYHYAIGSKYYPELGYERIYSCTWVALQELKQDNVEVPQVPQLRDLAEPDRMFAPTRESQALSADCHTRFSDARWGQFKTDLKRGWLDQGWDNKWWVVMLRDMGFNPPPSWSALTWPTVHVLPLTQASLEAWPWFDVLLIFGVGGGLVWWAFGPWGLAAYLIVLGTNWVASYRWTGGSFSRQLWFAFLVWGTALLHKKKPALAGVAMGASVAMRLFPAVFVLGALVGLSRAARDRPEERAPLGRFVAGAAASSGALFLLSLLLFDWTLWPEFFDKMRHHGSTFFTWHIGFKKWAVYVPSEMLQPAKYLQPGMNQQEALQAHLNGLYDSHRFLYDGFRGALMLAAAALAWRRPVAQATWVVGAVFLFCLSIPANYYYVYLALFPAVFWTNRGGAIAAVRMALFFAMLTSLSISTWVGGAALVQNGWINRSILWFLVALLITLAVEGDQATAPTDAPGSAEDPATGATAGVG